MGSRAYTHPCIHTLLSLSFLANRKGNDSSPNTTHQDSHTNDDVQSTGIIVVTKHTSNNFTTYSIKLITPLFKHSTAHPSNPTPFLAFISFTAPFTSSLVISGLFNLF